jgi:NAD-dependent dihydropyrimidine dehydrogenase PreA subunit
VPKLRTDIETYLVYIDAERCDGCAECAQYCPVGVFDVFHKASVVRPENCLGCRTCVAICKPAAVMVTEI